jgi:hypothetical protein
MVGKQPEVIAQVLINAAGQLESLQKVFCVAPLVYLVREPRRSTAPTSRLIPNENVLSCKGTLRL